MASLNAVPAGLPSASLICAWSVLRLRVIRGRLSPEAVLKRLRIASARLCLVFAGDALAGETHADD